MIEESTMVQGATTKRLFHVKDFEGPLDLLLYLIRKNEVNIYDIPISTITQQFIEFIDWEKDCQLEDLTEFYALAAQLLLIKSRMLLPLELDDEDEIEDPRRDLVEKLIEYQKYKKLSELIEEKELENDWVIERSAAQRVLPFEDSIELFDEMDVWDLLKTFSSLLRNISRDSIIDLYEEVSINEKITLLNELLESRERVAFTDLLIKRNSLMDAICAFLAILEAVKLKMITVYQHKLFGDIYVMRHQST